MPLSKDEKGGGTEADGSKSVKYCSMCYENGTFKSPEMTLEQMQKIADDHMRESGFSWLMRWFTKRMIPKLERWKS